MNITPTPEQQAASHAISAWIDSTAPIFVLTGYAGTGKTTTVRHTMSTFAHLRLCMSAPTHKAVGVLANAGVLKGAEYKTIHSLLGCRAKWVEDERVFEPDPDKWAWDDFDIVVLDEVSMVGDTIWSWVMDAQDTQRRRGQSVTRVLCMGDPAQLPPVKDGDTSPAFVADVPGAHLETVMRHDGAILNAATRVREHIADIKPATIKEVDSVVRLDGRQAFFDAWSKAMADTDEDVLILAWRNETVDWFNQQCRQRIYGDDVPAIPQPDEMLVLRDTHPDGFGGFLYTGRPIRVQEAEHATLMDLPCWHVRTSEGHDLHVLRPDTAAAHRKRLNRARKAKDWGLFRQLTEAFCRVRPGYATTIHKSQGSTYHTAFVIERDLMACGDHLTRNMLRYVAFSRAQEALYIA